MTRRVVSITLDREPRKWSFYAIYLTSSGLVASLRTPDQLGWGLGQLFGIKDGENVAKVGLVRTKGDGTVATVYPCQLLVVDKDDTAFGKPELLQVRVEDA